MAGTITLTYGPANVDSLLSTTLSAFLKTGKLADAIFNAIPLFNWLNQKARVSQSGGASLLVPIMYGKNATAKAYSGYGVLDTTPVEGITTAQYKWSQYSASITISGLEEKQNKGDSAVVKLLEVKTKQAEMALRDQMDIDLWASSQKTNGVINLPSLVDTTTTIADVSKSANSWWQAQVTASGSFAARGLSDLRNIYNTIMNNDVDQGAPDFITGAQAPFESYEGALQPAQRFTDDKMASAGFENLKYKSAVWSFDTNAPTQTIFLLRSENLKLVYEADTNFVNSPFIRPSNQDAKVAQILWMGNLVSDNIRRLGKLTGVTA